MVIDLHIRFRGWTSYLKLETASLRNATSRHWTECGKHSYLSHISVALGEQGFFGS